MISKKLAIAAATALMLAGMGAAQAQTSTPTTTSETQPTGLMTELSSSLANIFNAGMTTTIIDAVAGTPATYGDISTDTDYAALSAEEKALQSKYVIVDGAYVTAPSDTTGLTVYYMKTPAVEGVLASTVYTAVNPVDITALAGAVNMSTINGSIDISGANVSIKGVEGEVSAKAEAIATTTSDASAFAINGSKFATTVIGAMNSATLDVMNKTVDIDKTFNASLNIVSLAGETGTAGSSLSLPSLGATDLMGTISGGDLVTATGAFDLGGLTSDVSQTASSLTEELQSMNVFNMALNMAPVVAGVKIAATVDTDAWFLNPQTGVVDLSNIQISTTAIGAMNSSLTHLGANLTTLAK
ncbi:hypothetical protein [Hydrogenophaga sp.]|uniref:hypothetical protein n=1 Tax=Hydrogenophaga sp. TaxID=1904254 RepID=UPI00286E7649|nr:hypothetical protein [Hydrogenophaga sp.]